MHRSSANWLRLCLANIALILAGCSDDADDKSDSPQAASKVGDKSDNKKAGAKADAPAPSDPKDRLIKTGTPTQTNRLSVMDLPGGNTEFKTLKGGGVWVDNGREVFAGPGAKDIHIAIHPQVGKTRYYGMTFTRPCVVSVRDDGTVVLDQPDLEVTTVAGKTWVSRRVTLDGQDVFALFPKMG